MFFVFRPCVFIVTNMAQDRSIPKYTEFYGAIDIIIVVNHSGCCQTIMDLWIFCNLFFTSEMTIFVIVSSLKTLSEILLSMQLWTIITVLKISCYDVMSLKLHIRSTIILLKISTIFIRVFHCS